MTTKPNESSTLIKPKLFIFAAQDGRVGKSTACKMFVHNLRENFGQDPIVVDTDPHNPNVARSYSPEIAKSWGMVQIGEGKKTAKRYLQEAPKAPTVSGVSEILNQQIIIDGQHHLSRKILALTQFERDVVVNTPGNNYAPLCDFIDSQQAHKSSLFDLHICWVSNGSQESIDLLTKTQQRFPEASYLLFMNEGNSQYVNDWMSYRLPSQIVKLYNDKKLALASLPLLSIDPAFWEKRQNEAYTNWLSDELIDPFTRDAIKVWIDTACESIVDSECL